MLTLRKQLLLSFSLFGLMTASAPFTQAMQGTDNQGSGDAGETAAKKQSLDETIIRLNDKLVSEITKNTNHDVQLTLQKTEIDGLNETKKLLEKQVVTLKEETQPENAWGNKRTAALLFTTLYMAIGSSLPSSIVLTLLAYHFGPGCERLLIQGCIPIIEKAKDQKKIKNLVDQYNGIWENTKFKETYEKASALVSNVTSWFSKKNQEPEQQPAEDKDKDTQPAGENV